MARPNIIKTTKEAIKDSPREIFNWYLLICTWIWSFPGVAKGFDEGKRHRVESSLAILKGSLATTT